MSRWLRILEASSLALSISGVVSTSAFAQAPENRRQEPVDRPMIARIREEGLNRSQVAAKFNYLTNVIGPRLTGTSAYKRAAVALLSAGYEHHPSYHYVQSNYLFSRGDLSGRV